MRGATLYHFCGGDLVTVTLAGAGAEYTSTTDLTVPAGDGARYVVVTKDDPRNPTTWTASIETSAPSAADMTVRQIAHFTGTGGEIDGSLYQDWNGGNPSEFWQRNAHH